MWIFAWSKYCSLHASFDMSTISICHLAEGRVAVVSSIDGALAQTACGQWETDEDRYVSMASDGCRVPWGVVPNKEGQYYQEYGFAAFR